MNKTIKMVLIATGGIFGLVWILSVIFTMMTFRDQFEIYEGEYLVYEEIDYLDCSAIDYESKDLEIQFSYKYPLVDFNGKLEVVDINDTIQKPEGRLLFSGPYDNRIILKNLCYSTKDEKSAYKRLEFRFSDEDAAYWFYSDVGEQGYPFLKYDAVEIKISWFSIHPGQPYQIIPVD